MAKLVNPYGEGGRLKKAAPVRVKQEWMANGSKSLRYWGLVAKAMREKGVRSSDRAAMKSICQQVKAGLHKERTDVW